MLADPSRKQAFEALYKEHWYKLYCIACKQTGSPHDAEELVQALFEKVWKDGEALSVRRPVEDEVNGKITVGGKKYRMQRFYVAQWVFASPTHYFFPIQQEELGRDPALQQNPGW